MQMDEWIHGNAYEVEVVLVNLCHLQKCPFAFSISLAGTAQKGKRKNNQSD